ncbi:putative drug resistance transporter, MFS superfamily protein [Gordonia polyisoprenivorans VH2]|uniref:Putative drug resistance transporter, MFS superfamily protein n=1 Tax=Gordonia polyisoprenivorans (strain DSM 44266 / VH2) TaxID=1112204 RepID=H6N1D8_GORPV|nr:MFS transporter [Gordonia polyisoprenivorans]AFA72149.1 putative drug resistance transporter, MFS superfamily protein [Gordonia polyisoprenivorans VH2]
MIATSPTTPVRHRALIATVFTLQFLVALDMSLVNIALPAMRADLGFTASGLQWVVNAYLLTFAGFMLLGGRLGDLWGRRTVILAGLTVFAVASIVGGFATDPAVLVAARAIQGVAGALLAPASLALASSSDPAIRKTAMAFWGGAGAAGGAVGVVLSGLLTDWWSWRAVLFVNVPIVVVAFLAALRGVEGGHRRSVGRLDVPGAVLVTAGVASLVFAVAAAGDDGWASARAMIGFVAAALLLAGFVLVERTADHPLMPPRLLLTRSIMGANIFGFMLAAGQLAAFYFASLYVQTVWNVDSDVAGLLFLPFCAGVVVGIVVSGKLSARIGARNSIGLLGLLGAVGLGLFSLASVEFDFWRGMLAPSLVASIGIGGSMVLVGAVGTNGVNPAQVGVASGVLNSSRQLGGTIGLAVLVTIAASQAVPADGYRLGFAVGAVFLLAGSVIAWVVLPRHEVASTAP